MEKITSRGELHSVYAAIPFGTASSQLGMTYPNEENFWQVREQCRINDGTYTPIHVEGDDKMRFLHVSVDNPAKVSYTKDADKGRQDIQTRTTLAAYCDEFGLDITTANTPDAVIRAETENLPSLGTSAPRAVTIREKLGMIQDLIDEVLADIG